ncbi:DUF3427 domain-containing protein [Saccharospirillum sp.]|uniref:DUF3427 domain-containing protein n=1 Tax=Saccharospirillum sp. TaxID=2033801 RepID=UPI0034A0AB93
MEQRAHSASQPISPHSPDNPEQKRQDRRPPQLGPLVGRAFYWQSQRASTPTSKRGRGLIEHQALGIDTHLFVRESKLQGGEAAPFVYYGL